MHTLARVVVLHPEDLGGGLGGQMDLGVRTAAEVHPVAVRLGDAATGRHHVDVTHAGHPGVDPQRTHDLQRRLLVALDEFGALAPYREGQVQDADLGRGAGCERVRRGGQRRHVRGDADRGVVLLGQPVGAGPVRGEPHVRSAPCGAIRGSRRCRRYRRR